MTTSGSEDMKREYFGSRCGGLLAAVCVWCIAAAAGADHLIEVAPSLVVAGPDVLLKEISLNPSVLPPGWGDRSVVRSPEPGKRAEYSLVSIAYALQKYPDMNNVLLQGQNNIAIRRSATGMGSERVIEAVKQHILSDPRWNGAPVDIQCETIADYVHIPDKADVEIKVTRNVPQRETNRFMFETEITNPATSSKQSISVYARITPMVEVWSARIPLAAGHSPGPDDLQTGLVPADASAGYFPVTESIEGLELVRPVGINQPLTRRLLIEPVCARRGDVIDVVATQGAMTVSARATALSTGRRGDYILCVNEISSRRLKVQLTDIRKAEIHTGDAG